MLSADQAARYFKSYIEAYRQQYASLTADPPAGGGYPPLNRLPYLSTGDLNCFIARDGVAVAYYRDLEDDSFVNVEGNSGPGMERLPVSAENAMAELTGGGRVLVSKLDLDLCTLSFRLTLSTTMVFGESYQDPQAKFWMPVYGFNVRFGNHGTRLKRHFDFYEFYQHITDAAWDVRSIWIRARTDVLRHYARLWNFPKDAWIMGSASEAGSTGLGDSLSALRSAIRGLEHLLETAGEERERIFHRYLLKHPILIDPAGELVSEPRWEYPEGTTSPTGKTALIPDFVVKYREGGYRLVELERPGKGLATQAGQPRSEVYQSLWQIKEWRHYLAYHAHRVQDQFPLINSHCPGTVIISRSTEKALGPGRDPREYASMLSLGEATVVMTYDDLLVRARTVYAQLNALWLNLSGHR